MTIQVEGVSYRYRRGIALDSVSCRFEPGSNLILGPNGAGKSTLIEILASRRFPSAGQITLDGEGIDFRNRRRLREYRARVAWLPQKNTVYPGVSVREHVALAGWLKGLSKGAAWESSRSALETVDLWNKAKDSVRALSGGQTRRLAIAGALVHDAEILLFDEPLTSLDPSQRRRFRHTLADLAQTRTVVVSSHETDEVIDTYRRTIVLADGRALFDGTPASFVDGTAGSASDSERLQLAYERWVGQTE